MANDVEIISNLQKLLKTTLSELIGEEKNYALLDFPDYSNAGDSAIWLGEINILKEITGEKPIYVASIKDFDSFSLRKVIKNGIILINGGGNFGDIWKRNQDFREKILDEFPNNRIIQLPQTVYFSHDKLLNSSIAKINSHNDFHLLVRDVRSYEFSKQNFRSNIVLLPDCAFGIGHIRRPTAPKLDTLFLLRTDIEKKDYELDISGFGFSHKVTDWYRCGRLFNLKRRLLSFVYFTFDGFKGDYRYYLYQAEAKLKVEYAVKTLCLGKVVVTDRLHAHILSLLIGIPHITLDNNYGKLSGFINKWTKGYDDLEVVNSLGVVKDYIKKFIR